MSSTDVSPSATPNSTPLVGTHAPKFGTVIPSRIFVGGIAANTAESELKQYFSAFGPVKDAKIIADRAGVSKGADRCYRFDSDLPDAILIKCKGPHSPLTSAFSRPSRD